MSTESAATRIPSRSVPWKFWVGVFVFLIACTAAGIAFRAPTTNATTRVLPSDDVAPPEDEPTPTVVPVTVIHPRKGAMERLTTQPGSVHAFESVQLYAGVSGFLKTQNFLIGARVKKGQVLAVVDVPELEKKVERDHAAVDQVKSKVDQMTARVLSARAEAEAAEAAVKQAEASAKSAAAWLRYRQKQLVRYQELFTLKSIDERLVDEKKEQY